MDRMQNFEAIQSIQSTEKLHDIVPQIVGTQKRGIDVIEIFISYLYEFVEKLPSKCKKICLGRLLQKIKGH